MSFMIICRNPPSVIERHFYTKEEAYTFAKIIHLANDEFEIVTEQEAMERCVGNNTTHPDYDSVRLENLVYEMWNSGNGIYKSKVQLGGKIGLTGQWVGQLLRAKELRDKSKLGFDSGISSHMILDADALKDEDDKIQLLTLVKEGKIKPSDVKQYAKTLSKVSDDTRKNVLSGKQLLSSISNTKIPIPKKSVSTKTLVQNPNLIPEVYELLKSVQDHVALITDDNKKKEAINYVKFFAGLCLKILYAEGKIHKDFFESVVEHELDIDRDMLHHFDGIRTKGMSWWLGETSEESYEPTVEQAF